MRLKLLSFLILLFLIVFCTKAQESDKPMELRYMRPSITYLYAAPKNSQQEILINSLKEIEIEAMFNDHRIDYEYLSDIPAMPAEPGTNASYEEWDNYRRQVRGLKEKQETIKHDFVVKSTNKIVAKWFNRDSDGKLNMDLISERGLFTATDADAVASRSTHVDRRDMLGLELIDKTYIILWEITSIKTQEEVYREREAEKRDREGYVVNFRAHAYNLEFGDSVSAVFWQNYWTDETNFDKEKVKEWNNLIFPVKYIGTTRGEVSSTQPKDPTNAIYLFSRKKSMDELLKDIPQKIQTSAANTFGRTISDFLPRAPVYSTRPLSAKIGTKESIYFDQRFFIYELIIDENGNLTKERQGVARVRKIANNDTVATGDAEPSVFRQQGGKRIYDGMLMESSRDFGVGFNFGYTRVPENRALGGAFFSFDIRISRLISEFIKVGGLHIGIGGSFNIMNKVKPGIINMNDDNNTQLVNNNQELSGFTYSFIMNLSKEIYITRRGNIYLDPTIGVGLSNYTFNRINGKDISKIYEDNYNEDDWIWSSLVIPMQLGLGVHLNPFTTIEVRPGLYRTLGYSTESDYDISQHNDSKNFDSDWGFDKISNPAYLNSFLINIRFRL